LGTASFTAEVAHGESKPRILLSQEVGSASVECYDGEDEALPSSNFLEGVAPRELADCEYEEVQVEEEEEENQNHVDPQGPKAGKKIRSGAFQGGRGLTGRLW